MRDLTAQEKRSYEETIGHALAKLRTEPFDISAIEQARSAYRALGRDITGAESSIRAAVKSGIDKYKQELREQNDREGLYYQGLTTELNDSLFSQSIEKFEQKVRARKSDIVGMGLMVRKK